MRNEIGSEFWSVSTTDRVNKIFPDKTQWFLSGRSALTAIIRDIKKRKQVCTVAIPSWCCNSMIIPFLREGIEVHFYPVYWKNELVQEIRLDCDVLFLMDYFGYIGKEPNLTGYTGMVIRDVTHSFLSHSYSDASYYFGSLRKWSGIKTGGYAWGKNLEAGNEDSQFVNFRSYAMREKSRYINGETDDKEYLAIYEEAEEYLDELDGVYRPFEEDIHAALHLDVAHIRTQRRKNAKVLMSGLKHQLVFPSYSKADCPMFVPILVPSGKRDNLRRYLIQHDIYCPVHWLVSTYHRLGERELNIYQNELSLVCDQRYTEEDMYRMINTIAQFWKKEG